MQTVLSEASDVIAWLFYLAPGFLWYALIITKDRRMRVMLSNATRHMSLVQCEAGLDHNLRIVARYQSSIRRVRPYDTRFTLAKRRLCAIREPRLLLRSR